MRKEVKKYILKRPLFYAGIASLVLVFAGLVANSLFYLSDSIFVSMSYSIGVCLASIVFLYGFYVIGDKYGNVLLKVLSLIGIIFTLVFYFGGIISGPSLTVYFEDLNQTLSSYNSTLASMDNNSNLSVSQIEAMKIELNGKVIQAISPLFFVFFVLFILAVISTILWGVSLNKLGKMKYAKIAGILNIVGACTLVIFIGIFVLMAAFVFEILLLFDQAKKFKELKN